MTQKLDLKTKFLMGVTLFSHVFRSRKPDFPALSGSAGGTAAVPAFIGFVLSAVGLPVLGVIAVTMSGGLSTLASRVHPKFAFVYIAVLYLAIGPCLAIPRTASTSFSMAGPPFLPESVPEAPVQLLYTVVFFIAASLVAMHPEKLTEYLGEKADAGASGSDCRAFYRGSDQSGGPCGPAGGHLRSGCACRGISVRVSDDGHAGCAEFWNDCGD